MAKELTIDMVAKIGSNAIANGLEKEWPTFLETLRVFEINTKNRIAAFLMNVFKESGELYYVEEIASGDAYEWRADLGNNQPGDGRKYKGHGYIQITGRTNHRAVGKALGVDFETNPLKLTQLPYTWLSAGWYWRYGSSWGNLNDYADGGEYKKTILGVRGGPDTDRERYWRTAMGVLPDDVTLPDSEPAPPAPQPEEPPEPSEWPTRLARVNAEGWLVDMQSGAYIRTPEALSLKGGTDANGWWFGDVTIPPAPEPPKPEPTKWAWPVANDAPIPGGYYWQEYPTRYNWLVPKSVDGLTPRPDVEEWGRYIVDKWDDQVWGNTYYHHPPEVYPPSREKDSCDFWGGGGRGDPIDPSVGQAVFNELFDYPGKPDIDWIIWWGYMWTHAGGWSWYGDHFDHVHCTWLK